MVIAAAGRLPDCPAALLLDLDGTLSDSGPVITASIAYALDAVGAPSLPATQLRGWVGPPLAESFAGLPGFDAARTGTAVAAYRAVYDPLAAPLFDGVLDVLEQVRCDGVRLALATSKPQHYADLIVEGTGLGDLLEVVVGADEQAGRWSKGDCVGAALRLLGSPATAVMAGDRCFDVQGAAEHAVPCLGALWGYGDPAELRDAAALLRHPSELRYWAGENPPSAQNRWATGAT